MTEGYASHGVVFQENLVKVIFEDRAYADQISEVLEIEFFELSFLQKFLKLLLSYRKKYEKHPSVEIMLTVIDNENYENDLLKAQVQDFFKRKILNQEPVEDKDYIKEVALDFAKKQDLKRAMIQSIDLLKVSSFNEISKLINASLARGIDNDFGHDFIVDFEERYKKTLRNTISTGWSEIDRIMQGGLGAGELGVLIGSSGAGKSFSLVSLGATALKLGKNVIYFTCELSDGVIGQRFDTCISKVALKDLHDHKDEVFEKIKTIPGKLIIKKYPQNVATTQTLDSHIEKCIKRGFAPDLIIVDYADKLRALPSTRRQEKRHDLEEIYENLRNIAEKYQVPMWNVTQSNRDGAKSELITMEAISEAYNKVFPCDFILTITRTAAERQEGTARFFIVKNRMGEDGFVYPVKFDPEYVNIDVLPRDSNVSLEAMAEAIKEKNKKLSSQQMNSLKEKYKKFMDKREYTD